MPPAPSPFQQALRALVARLVLLLDGCLGARQAWLRARIAALPPTHKRRAPLLAELARAAQARALLADPESHQDPRFRGLIAQVARVRMDAGRRALARRCIHVTPWLALPCPLPAPRAELEPPEGRSTRGTVAPDPPPGHLVPAALVRALARDAHLAKYPAAP